MTRIFAALSSYITAMLCIAVLCFALAAAMLRPALDRDDGIPDISEMAAANGRVTSVNRHKYGVKFGLHGRAELFNYPSKARGSGLVESALVGAGAREVVVLFNPTPNTPWSGAEQHYYVWQVDINGESVRTVEESMDGWRSDNAISPWLCGLSLLGGLYFSVLARREIVRGPFS